MTDDDLFRQEFSDIKPLKKSSDKVELRKTPARNSERTRLARENAIADAGTSQLKTGSSYDEVSDDYVERVNPVDVLSFKRPGIQDMVFKKLRLGKYVIEGRLDLHRKKVVQAKAEVQRFIAEGINYDMRTLLIVHGKGERNPDEKATLKSYVNKWLKEHPDVMAFHSSSRQHGGVGALYVMLRKSEKAKQETREQLGLK